MSDQLQHDEIAAKYADLLPQLSRTATRCVKLLSSQLETTTANNNNSSSNEDAAVTTTSKWPQGEEYEFHKAFRGLNSFVRSTQKQHDDLLQLISVCYRDYAITSNNNNNNNNMNANSSSKKNINPIDAVDALFENVDHLLDSVRGVRVDADKQEEIRIGITGLHESNNQSITKEHQQQQHSRQHQQQSSTGSILSRPQDTFAIPADNFAAEFLPFVADPSNHQHNHHRKYSSKPGEHPLGLGAMERFQWPDDHLVPPASDQIFLALEQTPLTFVDTPDALQEIVSQKLSKATAIAVDVEHHSDHSYLGFTCLVQLSTREEDFVIDAIALHDDMWRLAPVFHDPKIAKVLHSAQEDVRWLQRDFGLFVVNLFDTAIALQTLRMPHSLAFLVDHICQIKLNKQHQNDDWRLRPLPQSMVKYARQDTHYLLYCWDRLRTMLATADTRGANSVGNLLLYVLNESKRLAATQYVKPAFAPETTWKEVFGRSISGLFPHQLKAIQSLFNWREVRARTVDTSPSAIMTNGQLLSVGCRLPSTAAEILRMTSPATVEVRKHVRELIRFLDEARSLMTSTTTTTLGKNEQNLVSRPDDAGAGSVNNNNNDNNKERKQSQQEKQEQQRQRQSVIHQPMTGTLPSVAKVSFSSPSPSSEGSDEVVMTVSLANPQPGQDAAIASSSSSSSSSFSSSCSWMNFVGDKSRSCVKSAAQSTSYWNPQTLAKTIHVPIPSGRKPAPGHEQHHQGGGAYEDQKTRHLQRRQDANSSDFTKLRRRGRDEAEDDDDRAPKNDDDSGLPEETHDEAEETAVASAAEPEKPSNEASAASSSKVQMTELPRSLAEEYGGLGRQTRKKASKK